MYGAAVRRVSVQPCTSIAGIQPLTLTEPVTVLDGVVPTSVSYSPGPAPLPLILRSILAYIIAEPIMLIKTQ